jgi:hypothetical protein
MKAKQCSKFVIRGDKRRAKHVVNLALRVLRGINDKTSKHYADAVNSLRSKSCINKMVKDSQGANK